MQKKGGTARFLGREDVHVLICPVWTVKKKFQTEKKTGGLAFYAKKKSELSVLGY